MWNGSPQAYRGTAVAGFPNLFIVTGPNTGLGHNSLVFMIEAQLDYLMDALRAMDAARRDARRGPPRGPGGLQRRACRAGWAARCGTPAAARAGTSTRNGMNTTIWPDFTWRYRRQTRHFDAAAYELTAPAKAGRGRPRLSEASSRYPRRPPQPASPAPASSSPAFSSFALALSIWAVDLRIAFASVSSTTSACSWS